MNFRNALAMMLSLLMAACASTHPGSMGKSRTEVLPIKLSAETVDYETGDAYQLIQITVENTSADWLRIVRSQIIIDDPATTKMSVVMGEDLRNWAQAMYERKKLEEHNEDMVGLGVAAVGILGMVAGASSNNSSLVYSGAGAAIAGSAYHDVNQISRSKAHAQQSSKAPDNHLYQPFSVPAKMFLRRWVVMSKPIGMMVKTIVIEFENVEGKKDRYEVSL